MRLYIMRHGPAEDHAKTGRDEDRELTHSGRDRVRGVARLLLKEDELPSRILTSRLVRAVETADIVQAAMAKAGKEVTTEKVRELAPGGPSLDLVRRLVAEHASLSREEHPRGVRSPMLVGHEPDLSGLVDQLLGKPLGVPMDKAMVVALKLDGEDAKLRFVVEPRTPDITHDHRRR